MNDELQVVDPLIIVFTRDDDDEVHYGIVGCDLVRHIANAYNVREDKVWYWIDKERYNRTGTVKRLDVELEDVLKKERKP